MSFGLSFGDSNQKTTTNTTGTSTTSGTQANNQTSSGTQNTTSNQTTSGSQTGQSATTNAQTGTQVQQQQQQSTSFSNQVLQALNDSVTQLLGGAGKGTAAGATNNAIAQAGQFDPAAFIQQIMSGAKAQIGQQTETSLNGIKQAIGGTDNSMTALLAGQLQNQAAGQLAGIEGQATSQAEGILNQNAQTANAANSGQASIVTQLLDALKGGQVTTAGSGATQTASAGNESTNTAQQSQSSSQDQQVQTFAQLLNALLTQNSTTNTNQTQVSNVGKTSGGFSFGF